MPNDAPPAPPLMKEVIPAEFHDRPYLKDWLDKPSSPELMADVFKKLDGAEKLIGKKTVGGVPGLDAKPEEIEAFYHGLRPAKPEDYEFKLGEKPDEDFVKELRAAAHGAGLDKRQMSKFIDALAPGFAARQKAQDEAQSARDKEFEGIVATTFGKDNEKVVARVGEAIKDHTPEPLRPHIDKLDNNALAILTGIINAVLVKYVPEDELKSKGGGGGAGETDRATLQTEARKLMALPAYKDFQNPDHEKTTKRVAEIYANAAFK